MIQLPSDLQPIFCNATSLRQAFLVGGCVRDSLLGHAPSDFDIEVFDVDYPSLVQDLQRWGRVDVVGKAFGVAKLTTPSGNIYDFSLPRRDSKIGKGHKGFETQFDPSITPREAASRRDFTINSLMFDPRDQKLLDFFGGEQDLRNRILRHTSEAFTEDPLRVLRGMQFATRFNLTAAPETILLCQQILHSFQELPIERIRAEWFKWAESSKVPSAGLRFLQDSHWLQHFPELHALVGTPQDPEWHPEGNVFIHTCYCCDALVQLEEWQTADTETRIVLMFAVLTHDTGKPSTTHTVMRNGSPRIVSPGHEAAGGKTAEHFLARIGCPVSLQKRIIPLVTNHMVHFQEATPRLIRRLAKRLEPENIRSLCVLMRADQLGRPPRPPKDPCALKGLLELAEELSVQHAPEPPLLRGKHLFEFGLQQGKELGQILHQSYDAQLEGEFRDLPGALHWLESKYPHLRRDS